MLHNQIYVQSAVCLHYFTKLIILFTDTPYYCGPFECTANQRAMKSSNFQAQMLFNSKILCGNYYYYYYVRKTQGIKLVYSNQRLS